VARRVGKVGKVDKTARLPLATPVIGPEPEEVETMFAGPAAVTGGRAA